MKKTGGRKSRDTLPLKLFKFGLKHPKDIWINVISCQLSQLHIYLNWLSLARMSAPSLVIFLNYLPELDVAGKNQRHLLSAFSAIYLTWL